MNSCAGIEGSDFPPSDTRPLGVPGNPSSPVTTASTIWRTDTQVRPESIHGPQVLRDSSINDGTLTGSTRVYFPLFSNDFFSTLNVHALMKVVWSRSLHVGLPSSRLPHALDHHPIGQRNRERDTILRTEVSRDVTFAIRVFNQVDVSGARGDMDASRYFDFQLPASVITNCLAGPVCHSARSRQWLQCCGGLPQGWVAAR